MTESKLKENIMFGYVIPYKMELKIKDYEKIKAYYCGLCRNIKYNFGNVPRITLNYDTTFLAILLDSFNDNEEKYIKRNCILHPIKKRIFLVDNEPLRYASYLNIILTYHKLLDDVIDDKTIRSRVFSSIFKTYLNKIPENFQQIENNIKENLNKLYYLEKSKNIDSLDELSHPFGELTAYTILSYINNKEYDESLYHLGYNLGKWIYIIDAYDDLEKDIKNNEFNGINLILNKKNIPYKDFVKSTNKRIHFILTSYARECSRAFEKLPIEKNRDILFNVFNFGLLAQIEKVFETKEMKTNERSLRNIGNK